MSLHNNHRLLFALILFGFLGLSAIIAIGPAIWVQANTTPIPGDTPMTELEREGLGVYISEGCVACHTQQVRPLAMDSVWGRPSAPGDYADVTPLGPWSPYAPAVLGSARTGPDLSNVGARQGSEVWQHIHLFNPRIVVADSVMPGYPWLYEVVADPADDDVVVPVSGKYAPESGSVVATDKAKALVAYLLSLKQAPLESSHAGGAH